MSMWEWSGINIFTWERAMSGSPVSLGGWNGFMAGNAGIRIGAGMWSSMNASGEMPAGMIIRGMNGGMIGTMIIVMTMTIIE